MFAGEWLLYKFHVMRLDRYVGAFMFVILGCEILVLCFIIYFIVRESRKIYKERKEYFRVSEIPVDLYLPNWLIIYFGEKGGSNNMFRVWFVGSQSVVSRLFILCWLIYRIDGTCLSALCWYWLSFWSSCSSTSISSPTTWVKKSVRIPRNSTIYSMQRTGMRCVLDLFSKAHHTFYFIKILIFPEKDKYTSSWVIIKKFYLLWLI